jgi:BirA family biotin operon repressor/biotin-[acetyl-CoA-carboxylase] ligase
MPRALSTPTALTMAAGLAVRDALAVVGLPGARIKWPNDVLAGAEKVAGILIEARGLDPARPAFVCGVGVNVAQRAFPPDLRRAATSLALQGVAITPAELAERLTPLLDARLTQADADAPTLAADFARAAELSGRVRVSVAGAAEEGVVAGFGLDGIALETAHGPRRLALEHVTAVEPA